MEYKTPPLKEVTGKNRFCGPAVVSSLTGITTDEVSKRIRAKNGRTMITGTKWSELYDVLYDLGYTMFDRTPVRFNPTLAKWLRNRTPEQRKRTYLVELTDHWAVIRGNKFCDSHTREPVFIRQAPFRRARVKSVSLIHKW